MIEEVKDFLEEKKLLTGIRRVIIGYSGGPDSTFLRDVLSGGNREVVLAYFNHNLRDDSTLEEEFVRKEAERVGLNLKTSGEDVRGYCKKHSLSIEDGARALRLNYLRRIKGEEGASIIALGHNLDDQIENFFIRLFRGSGFGLSSMRYCDGDIIRPLLHCRKEEIIKYLDSHSIPYYKDPSNEDTSFLRNRIRGELIPVIENIKDGSIKGLKKSIENIRDMEDALRKHIENIQVDKYRDYVEVDREDFDRLSISEKFLLVKKMLSFINREKELKRAHVTNLPLRGIIELKGSSIEMTPSKVLIVLKGEQYTKELPLGGELSFGGFYFKTLITEPPVKFPNNSSEYFDLEELKLPLGVKRREKGDQMVVFGANDKKKLKEIFINEKIPRTLRDSWPIIYDREGVILIPGLRRSNRAIVSDKTNKVLKIIYKEVKYGRGRTKGK